MPSIVQFTHPGPEHKPDKKNILNKEWNTKQHKRKFLCSKGDFVDSDGIIKKSKLFFWGEWEPPSRVKQLNKQNEGYPQYLHFPYLPKKIPNLDNLQNTDPFVFENSFKYSNCKQYESGRKRTKRLAKLEDGSLILFGSTKGQTKEKAFFMVDTVFVIREHIDYNPMKLESLNDKRISTLYKDVVLRKAFPKNFKDSYNLRIYIGATYKNQVNGMYSFSPSKIYQKSDNIGFPRIRLENLPYITNNLNAHPKTLEASLEEIKLFWDKIIEISRKADCVEGIKFHTPSKES